MSTLPFEILLEIAAVMPTQDKLTCATVCKAWTLPFQESMWGSITINTKQTLKDICRVSTTNPSCYQKFGSLVTSLTLGARLQLTDQQLYTIQALFGNIKHLKIPTISHNLDISESIVDWNLWSSLSSLEIYMQQMESDDDMEELFYALSLLPHLKKLHITEDYGSGNMPYRWQAFEAIHTYLPQLEYLQMDVGFEKIYPEDMEEIYSIEPANSLTTANFLFESIDIPWLYYFASKYPNLHTFRCNIAAKTDTTYADYNADRVMLSKILSIFPKLETIAIKECENNAYPHGLLCKLLYEQGVKLKNIEYVAESENNTQQSPEDIIYKLIDANISTLETLTIKCHDYSSQWMSFVDLTCWTNLIDLNIYSNWGPVQLDRLLDRCPALKNLRLSSENIVVSSKPLDTLSGHGLETVKFDHASLSSESLDHLSFRCRKLQGLSLKSVKIRGSISQETGNLTIDISHTPLKSLEFIDVTFYESSGTNCTYDTAINFIVLDRPSIIPELEGSLNAGVEISGMYCAMANSNPIWFHQFQSYPKRGYSRTYLDTYMRNLDNGQATYAKEYFQSFQKNIAKYRKPDSGMPYHERGAMGDSWTRDLHRGYVSIKCPLIEKYLLKGFKWDIDYIQ
ncbi:hypothetical protein CLU79DRAFT_836409 [Phycomyces nitens]|nr:hypothetical protein CLU79DRAFT_836409 [Phycomyces nitens]